VETVSTTNFSKLPPEVPVVVAVRLEASDAGVSEGVAGWELEAALARSIAPVVAGAMPPINEMAVALPDDPVAECPVSWEALTVTVFAALRFGVLAAELACPLALSERAELAGCGGFAVSAAATALERESCSLEPL
jgi:hypothetical protein